MSVFRDRLKPQFPLCTVIASLAFSRMVERGDYQAPLPVEGFDTPTQENYTQR